MTTEYCVVVYISILLYILLHAINCMVRSGVEWNAVLCDVSNRVSCSSESSAGDVSNSVSCSCENLLLVM